MRIALAGFQHETNTFSADKTCIQSFQMADSWPCLLEAEEVITQTRGMNLPIAGAIHAAGEVELLPIVWCAAEPAGHVTDKAFDYISRKILTGLESLDAVDAVYLDLHGAMVTESYQDGEGELIRRIRTLLGPDVPIGVSLDLHANISPDLVQLATLITVYRTYPHLDMAETGARCMRRLIQVMEGQTFFSTLRQIPFLVPLHAQYTEMEPCKTLYELNAETEKSADQWSEIALGFTASDIFHCGPSILAYADSQEHSDALADNMFTHMLNVKNEFNTTLYSAESAIRIGMRSDDPNPVVIADVQDNPGAGGSADTTTLLQTLIDMGAEYSIVGIVCDPDTAQQAHRKEIGSSFHARLGGKSTEIDQSPVTGVFTVLSLSDGEIVYTGEMYGGGVARMGLSCLLSIESPDCDVQVVVSSNRIQCLDRAQFEHFGVNLSQKRIICVKSTVHYRADFDALAYKTICVSCPGLFSCEPTREHYQRLRPDVEFLA